MFMIMRVQSSFRQRDNLGWAQHCFVNDLVGFPGRKKSKPIYEGITTRECQVVPYACQVLRNAKKFQAPGCGTNTC